MAGNQITRAGCWAHLKRKVIDAEKSAPEIAKEAVERVRALYAVERQAQNATVEARLQLRQSQTAPLLVQLRERLLAWKEQLLPKHPMSVFWYSAVPKLGVTCPLFIHCVAARSYNSPYRSISSSHRRCASGCSQARRSRLRKANHAPRSRWNVIPLSLARNAISISPVSNFDVQAKK